jgi:phage tail protein X
MSRDSTAKPPPLGPDTLDVADALNLAEALVERLRGEALWGELADHVAGEVFGRAAALQDALQRARRGLADVDAALVEALAIVGVPTRPGRVAPFRSPRPQR